jgi:L-aspartate oxidase
MTRIKNGFKIEIMSGDEHKTVYGDYCLLASGGIGRVYKYTTNPSVATGDGIRFAYEMGAAIKNLSYVQFHPTAFNNRATRECFLISEAVRGEGAYLLNCHKERFMHNYDKRLELAPRDVVSHSIVLESRKQNSTDFYLDISYKDSEFLKKRFPMIYKNLMEQGYDLTKEPVPIFPCQHYLMGGIDVDSNSETTLPNLYACGECSHTGVHGSNRLASNSLLEALVFSRKAAENIATKLDTVSESFEEVQFDAHMGNDRIPAGIRTETRKIMQNSYFVIPDKEAAAEGLKRVTEIRNDLLSGKYVVDADYVLAKSIVTVAYIILNEVIQ